MLKLYKLKEREKILDGQSSSEKSCQHHMGVRSVHDLVVRELENGFGCGELIAYFRELLKVKDYSKFLSHPLTELKEAVEWILVEDIGLLHEVHKDCLSLTTEGHLISNRVREPLSCKAQKLIHIIFIIIYC